MVAAGKPQRAVAPVLYSVSDDLPPRWLGAFVFTEGHKLLFFPPKMTDESFELFDRGNLSAHGQMSVDHVTLNPDLETGHLTSPSPRDHQRGIRTTPHGEAAYLWFSLNIADESLLREVREKTKVEIQVDEKELRDAERRGQILRDASASEQLFVISISEEAKKSYEGYPSVTVMVGAPGFQIDCTDPNIILPARVGAARGDRADIFKKFPPTSQSLLLGEQLKVQLNAVWVPGTLDEDLQINVAGPVDVQ